MQCNINSTLESVFACVTTSVATDIDFHRIISASPAGQTLMFVVRTPSADSIYLQPQLKCKLLYLFVATLSYNILKIEINMYLFHFVMHSIVHSPP